MQTFVPYADMHESAVVLDNKRLNKQLLEGRQIYNIISDGRTTGGWISHPAVKMWRNYDNGLYMHILLLSTLECVVPRYCKADKELVSTIQKMHENNWDRGDNIVMPPWWGDERVHESHRNNLYVKDPEYYAEFGNDSRVTCCEDMQLLLAYTYAILQSRNGGILHEQGSVL
jgi:hypothetical protein